MKNLTLTKENVEIERKVILIKKDFKELQSDPSSFYLMKQCEKILYPNHPYGTDNRLET